MRSSPPRWDPTGAESGIGSINYGIDGEPLATHVGFDIDVMVDADTAGAPGRHVASPSLAKRRTKAIGRGTSHSTIYDVLARHGWRKLMPRPFHPKRDLAAQNSARLGQNLNGLAIDQAQNIGVHQFLYGRGQAETAEKNRRRIYLPRKCALPRVIQIGQSRAQNAFKKAAFQMPVRKASRCKISDGRVVSELTTVNSATRQGPIARICS